jgi:hypothetical protein
VLEEVALADATVELVPVEEVVVGAVDLARALPPRRRRDGDLEMGEAGKDALDQRSLPRPRRSRDDDDARTRRYR